MASELFGRGAVAERAVVFDAEVRDDREIGARGLARGQNRFADFIEIGERFEDEEIDAGIYQHFGLFAEQFPGFFETGGAERLQPSTQRSDGAGHEGLVTRGLPGETDARFIDRAEFFGMPERREALAICAEGVGFEDLGAGFNVFLVDFANQGRERQVQFVVAAINENAFGVERRAHGAVGDEDAVSQRLLEFFRSGLSFRIHRYSSLLQLNFGDWAGY